MYKNISVSILSLITLSILLILTNGITDISLLNCPSSYLKSKPISNQNDFIQFGQTLYSAYQTQSNQQSVYKIVIQGDIVQFQSYSTFLQLPYIIIGVVFIIILLFVICWCLFSRTCPPWEWTKRDPFLNPYTKKQMKYTLFWLIIFSVSILIISILIISEIPNLKENIQSTKCSMFVTVDTALYGSAKNGWTGFKELKNNVGNISSLISSTMTQIGLYFTGDQWLQDDMTIMKTKNNQIYSQNQDAQLVSPNPYKTATQVEAGFGVPKIDSSFIKKGLGPIGQPDTLTTQVQIGLNTTQVLSDQAYKIDRGTRLIQDSVDTIRSNFVQAQNKLSMYIHQLETILKQIQTFTTLFFQQKFSTFLVTIQIIISACLIGAMLILIGAFSTSTFQILDCRKMVHIGWIIWALSFLGSLILLYIFLGLGSISYGFCSYYDQLLSGSQTLTLLKSQNSQNALNRLGVCINGNGNVLQSFSMTRQLQTLTDLYYNINTFDAYTNTSSLNYINKTFSIDTLQDWIDNIQKYKKGIFLDSNPLQTNEDNPNYTLGQLNLFSNTGSGGKTCSKDRWVWDRANCTVSSELTYNTTDEANGRALTTDKVLCISFNQGFATGFNRSWNMEDFTRRYVQIRQTCPGAFDSITLFAKTLIDYRDSRINLFQGIQDRLNDILDINSDFNQLLDSFRSRVTQFSDSTKSIRNFLISESTGIKFTSNCSIIGQKIRDTNTLYCKNFMSQIVRMGLYSLILSILILFGIWAGSLFAVRYSEIEKHQRMNSPSEDTDSQRIISDKKSQEEE